MIALNKVERKLDKDYLSHIRGEGVIRKY